MLRPGTSLVHRPLPFQTTFGLSGWPSALVIAVDMGQVPSWPTVKGRIATVTLLVTGPKLIRRDVAWVNRFYVTPDAACSMHINECVDFVAEADDAHQPG